ncbi:MAG: zinc-dependent metalloprotease [Planctomycetota bacterium]
MRSPASLLKCLCLALCSTTLFAAIAHADLASFSDISKDYKPIAISDQTAIKGLFNLWKRDKDAQLLGELPKNFSSKRYFIALTVGSGDRYAGLQFGDLVAQWRRYDDRLALIIPNLEIRATGDAESRASVKRLFTDRVLLDVPILALGPTGGPVIDLDSLLVANSSKFFASDFGGGMTGRIRVGNTRIVKLKTAKVFPDNVEIAFEIVGSGGKLQTIHYSFSEVPNPKNFKPRKADERIGYFTTTFSDLSKYIDDETTVRFINRWKLEKRDPSLKLSPPKAPIRFYVEHTAPVRYRRWIKAGVDYWNKAFEKVGLVDAIVIEYQDAQSRVHMEKDPEDVRYNFIRWLNNDIGTAIGPSRVHPETGEILDADIILTDGWIRYFNYQYEDLMPSIAMEGMSAETLAWLGSHPNWDPRLRLARPENQNHLRSKFARQAQTPGAGFKMFSADPTFIGDDEFDGLYGQISQKNGLCMAGNARSLDLALARMDWALSLIDAGSDEKAEDGDDEKEKDEEASEEKEGDTDKDEEEEAKDVDKDEEKKEEADKKTETKTVSRPDEPMLDGMPEWFVGPLLADLVAHEVGHTLGLRHNFKASSYRMLDDINSEDTKGKQTITASVMDYSPINFRFESGETQGDYGMIDIGPYDFWAIEYGYTFDTKKLPEILKRCTEPALQYATDEDTSGPDPLARRYDFAKDPLSYAKEQVKLVKLYRTKLLDRFVKDGESWAKARRGYELTLGMQTRAASMMANWVGGAFVNRDKKGDPGNRVPVEVVPAEDQREALVFVIDTMFQDESYGLTPELLERMSVDKWLDGGGLFSASSEAAWPIHDRVLGVQSTALTWLMNPTTLRRVYDNELRLPADQDALTLPELLEKVSVSVWTELDADCPEDRNDRNPMISSLRRNLQREHTQRLIDLVLEDKSTKAASRPISNLARMELRQLSTRIEKTIARCDEKIDAYTRAHLVESRKRIDRALEAGYTYNAAAPATPSFMFMMGTEPAKPAG